jgi:Methyltransferase domain/C-methyltransferase C-terminal domain
MKTEVQQDRKSVASTDYAGVACRCCRTAIDSVFYEVHKVPAHSVLLMTTREVAIGYPRGDIVLGFCNRCGFISNVAFSSDLNEYSDRYEETQAFSPTFNAFHQVLARRLIQRYSLYGKTIIEIGCGKGEFLNLLCEGGNNNGIGFDPSYIRERNHSAALDRITFITDFYSPKYADYKAQFVCCKMTLEHITDPDRFIGVVRRSIGDDPETVVFFQVPDVSRILRQVAFWDIYYEHCSYFSAGTLCRLFQRHQFEVLRVGSEYGDQYLSIEARPAKTVMPLVSVVEKGVADVALDVAYFKSNAMARLAAWKCRLKKMKEDGVSVVLWGGGSKAVAFLTTLGVRDEIQYVVDINPYRHGTYIAGTGQAIVGPQFLAACRPDVVILMNSIYQREVENELARLRIQPQILTV